MASVAMLVATPGAAAGAASFGAPKIDLVATQTNPLKDYFADIADERSTWVMSIETCLFSYAIMIPFCAGFDPGHTTQGEIDDLTAKVRDWCDKYAATH